MKRSLLLLAVAVCSIALHRHKDAMIDIREFGAVDLTGHISASERFRQAIASLPSTGGGIRVPSGRLLMQEPLHINKPVFLLGSSGNPVRSCELFFDGCAGLVIDRYNTGGAPGFLLSIGGDWSVIQSISITGAGKTVGGEDTFGVWMRARATLRDVAVAFFGGDGVRIQASVDLDNTVANCWRIDNCRIQHSGKRGLWVRGGDTNAGLCTGLDVTASGEESIYDDSFLGNCYEGCHVAASDIRRGYWTGQPRSKGNSFFGCYVEGDQLNYIPLPSIVVGGTLSGADFAPGGTPFIPGRTGFVAEKDVSGVSYPKNGYRVVGGGAYDKWYNEDDIGKSLPLEFDYRDYAIGLRRSYGYSHGNAWGRDGMRISGGHTVLEQWPQMLPPLQHLFPQGVYLGPVKVVPGDGIPTSDTWNKGDRVLNTSGEPGQPREWVCGKSGTAGVFPEPSIRAMVNGSPVVFLTAAPSHPETSLGCITVGSVLVLNGKEARVIYMTQERTTLTMSEPIPAAPEPVVIAYSQPEFFT